MDRMRRSPHPDDEPVAPRRVVEEPEIDPEEPDPADDDVDEPAIEPPVR